MSCFWAVISFGFHLSSVIVVVIIYTVYIIGRKECFKLKSSLIAYFFFNRKDSEIITKERDTNYLTKFSMDGILAISAKGIHQQSKYLKFSHKCKIPTIQNKE